MQRVGRQLNHGRAQNRDGAPDEENHHHHRGDDHDLQSLLAGLVHALRILPPEVSHHDYGQPGSEMIVRKMQWAMHVYAHVFNKACEILPGGNRADGSGQDIVEEQRRDGKLGQRSTHGLLDHAINAAAHEHAAGFDIKRPHRIAEQHDARE